MPGPVGVCCRCGSWRVETSVELDALLTAIAAVVGPSWVELIGADNTVLRVAVGRDDLSSLTYADPTTAECLACTGTRLPLGDELFDDRGLPTPLDPHSVIPVTDARAAAREFLETGQRPVNLDWHDPRASAPRRVQPGQRHRAGPSPDGLSAPR